MSAQPKRILVAYDGSEAGVRALDAAAQLVGYGSSLTVVHVSPDSNGNGPDALAAARERLLGQQVTASYLARAGEPAEEIVEAARELEADLVVVGRRTPPVPESVSAQVARNAPSDVLVVR